MVAAEGMVEVVQEITLVGFLLLGLLACTVHTGVVVVVVVVVVAGGGGGG